MKGGRLPDGTDWSSRHPYGSYWKMDGSWYCITPNGEFGWLKNHTVTEHEDGSISVSPSILVHSHQTLEGPSPGWHGFLERGVWREC